MFTSLAKNKPKKALAVCVNVYHFNAFHLVMLHAVHINTV